MFYNWKYCSFYPNNFGASALQKCFIVTVPRPWYMCTPTEVHAYPDRSTHVSRSGYDNFLIFFRAFSDIFQSFFRYFSELFQIFFRAFSDIFQGFFRCFLSFQKAPIYLFLSPMRELKVKGS